jgi:hypothetical protein
MGLMALLAPSSWRIMEVAEELRGLLKPLGEDDSAQDCIAQAMEQDVVNPPQARRSVSLAGSTPRGK